MIEESAATFSENILNCGSSYGLKYPLIFAKIDGTYVVWCRHCGIVFATAISERAAEKKCRHLNGLDDRVDPKVLAAIDETP